MNVGSFDPNHSDLGWQPSIPEPFWVRSWRTWFRWTPACYPCRMTFKDTDEYGAHWLRHHQEQA